MTDLSPALREFVTRVDTLLSRETDEERFLPDIGEAMRTLVADDGWLQPEHAAPHPEYYQQYLLYADPEARFSVVSFVWGPGQETPIHDHTVWGVIGMLRGAELAQNYRIGEGGVPKAEAEPIRLEPGAVEFVSPRIGDVHRVSNALSDEVSISIHAYGADIGEVERHVYPPEGGKAKRFVSGYANAH